MSTHFENDSIIVSADSEIQEQQSPILKAIHVEQPPRTPIPKMQLAIILLIQFSEPLTANVIYPFVNQFVRYTGITDGDERATGYYAGIIESIFFIAEGVTVLAWQRASDRFGRRPFLIFAPLGLCFSMLAFGLSKEFWGLVVARCFQGIFNGNIAISKTVMGEMTDSTNRADVLAAFPIMWLIGITLAPCIGGVFVSPAEHWPTTTLGKIPSILKDHPFFLPCAISATFCFIAFCFAFVSLKETAPSVLEKRKRKLWNSGNTHIGGERERLLNEERMDYYSCSSGTSSTCTLESETTKTPTITELFCSGPVLLVLVNYGMFAFIEMCNNALQSLVWTTSIQNGGLGFDAFTVGIINTAFGIPNAIFQILTLGTLLKRFGSKRLIQVASIACLVYLCLYPLENYMARQAGKVDWRVWTLIITQLLCGACLCGGWAALQMYLIEISPNPSALSTIQGLGQTISVVGRAMSPSTATSLFALSMERNLLNGYFVYFILGIVDLGVIHSVGYLPQL